MNEEKLLAHGFVKSHNDHWCKEVPVRSLSGVVRSLFDGTDVNDDDIALVWVVFPEGVGISVLDCNAHEGTFNFDDTMAKAILGEVGVE